MFTRGAAFSSQRLSQIARHTQIRAMSYSGSTATLNTGTKIPLLGFGTWQDKDAQADAVAEAIKAGYRHIDTARVYGTEPGVAEGIKKAGVPREELFITTKLWNNAHHPDDVEAQLDESLKDLNTSYVDLWLMHWPSPFARSKELFPKDGDKNKTGDSDYVDTFNAMAECVKKGKVRAVGVSNFSKAEMERLLSKANVKPAAHQLEMHPYLAQHSFSDFHRENGIHITHYSPFGNSNEIYSKGQQMGKLIEDPVLVEIGKKHGKNGAQVALAWGIAKGHSVIPKSKTPSRIKANLEGDFKLDAEEIKQIDALDKKLRFNDPSGSFGWNFYTDLDGKSS